MIPLLSDSQLRAIQSVGRGGMKVAVIVKRPVFTAGVLGDDESDTNPATVVQPPGVLDRGVLRGYLRQTGGDNVGGVDIARMTTSSTFELGLPIGSNIETRDIVVIEDREYPVQDVLDDETWPGMLNCTLRRGT